MRMKMHRGRQDWCDGCGATQFAGLIRVARDFSITPGVHIGIDPDCWHFGKQDDILCAVCCRAKWGELTVD